MRIVYGLFLYVFLAAPVHAGPSFDCAAARSPSELTICRHAALGDLDRALAAAYHRKSAALDSQRARQLRGAQKAWLAYRDTCLADRACLERRYKGRIADLGGGPPTLRVLEPIRPATLENLRIFTPVETPRLRILGTQLQEVRRVVSPLEYMAVLSVQGTDPEPDPPGATVTPDGTIEKPLSDGRVALFNPATGDRAYRNPDGTMTSLSFLEVQGDELPVLPDDYADWSSRVAGNLAGLVGNLLTQGEVDTLQSTAPATFFENLDYQLEILAFITG